MPNLTDSPAQAEFFPLFEDENHNLSFGAHLVRGPSDERLNLTSVPLAKNNITVLQQSSKSDFASSSEWGWAVPAKKNEASIFFPPAKMKGAHGHNECQNATRIIMDMDHKPARKSGR